ncbi:MAG: WecB/TagA/CpsF family glycosyltransferase, partial [Flavobacteriales bacterium]|nr:WecB/TagA/CpsF family glycosyltransferase [Flavobacteriales bacterium]
HEPVPGRRSRSANKNDLCATYRPNAQQQRMNFAFSSTAGKDSANNVVEERAAKEHPTLVIAGAHAPPFGPLEAAMDLSAEAQRIDDARADIVMVSGMPEAGNAGWHSHERTVNGVMMGLGGAFLLYSKL